jgi:hypothetical protein
MHLGAQFPSSESDGIGSLSPFIFVFITSLLLSINISFGDFKEQAPDNLTQTHKHQLSLRH